METFFSEEKGFTPIRNYKHLFFLPRSGRKNKLPLRYYLPVSSGFFLQQENLCLLQ